MESVVPVGVYVAVPTIVPKLLIARDFHFYFPAGAAAINALTLAMLSSVAGRSFRII
jgi:hypothetical protein